MEKVRPAKIVSLLQQKSIRLQRCPALALTAVRIDGLLCHDRIARDVLAADAVDRDRRPVILDAVWRVLWAVLGGFAEWSDGEPDE